MKEMGDVQRHNRHARGFVNASEAAVLLGVCHRTVKRWYKAGKMPPRVEGAVSPFDGKPYARLVLWDADVIHAMAEQRAMQSIDATEDTSDQGGQS